MFCMSSYIKELKKYAKYKKISNEEFVRELFDTEIGTLGLKNRDDEYIDIDKSRISRILSQKDDVPSIMRKALTEYNAISEIEESFTDFCADYLDENMIETASKGIRNLIETDDAISDKIKDNLLSHQESKPFLFYAFVEAIKITNKKEEEPISPIWSKGANAVYAVSGDLFKYGFENRTKNKSIVVIPVNSAFDTHITTQLEKEPHPLVSEKTVHGQWILRYKKSEKAISELDSRINQSLKAQNIQPIGQSISSNGKQDLYQIGTIAVIDEPNAYFYLLAASNFNEKNVAHSTIEDIKASIKSLLTFYNENGQGYPLYIPLIGTGRSRAGMSLQESYNILIESFIENESLIQGTISIVIQNQVYNSLKKEWR